MKYVKYEEYICKKKRKLSCYSKIKDVVVYSNVLREIITTPKLILFLQQHIPQVVYSPYTIASCPRLYFLFIILYFFIYGCIYYCPRNKLLPVF